MAQASVGSSALAITIQRALIVDDCRFIAERMARTLEARGFTCTVVADGYRGLELLRDGGYFDLIVLDIHTPKVDGLSLLRYLRRDVIHFHTPVLVLSAEYSNADCEQAVTLGASYMTKPLQLRPLTATLDAILD